MKRLGLSTVALLALLTLTGAHPGYGISFTPSPADLGDLDHHLVYTWRIDNITLDPNSITGASLTFNNISNWDANPNVLHLHLLDTAKGAGVQSFVDDPTGAAPVTDFTDDFISTRYHSLPGWLVAAGTSDTFLTDQSFTLTPVNWTYTFDASQLASLRSYISNGHDIAIGFDPDCHFFNNGITFRVTVPDTGGTISLFACSLFALAALRRTLSLRRATLRVGKSHGRRDYGNVVSTGQLR